MDILQSLTGTTLIEGHRGAEGVASGNSWGAIQAGYARGADFLELDVHRGKDGTLVLSNGYVLPDGRWIRDLDVEALKTATPEGHALVFLQDVLEWVGNNGVFLSLDIKNGFGLDRLVFEDTLKCVEAHGLVERVMFLAWDHASLLFLKERNPAIKTRILLRGVPVAFESVVQHAQADAVNIDADMITPNTVQSFHAIGIAVALGMTHMPDISYGLELGVDIISVRDPGMAREHMQSFYQGNNI